jgi:hypothetical protein
VIETVAEPASVLVDRRTPEVVIYADPEELVAPPVRFAELQLCPLYKDGTPLPYRIVEMRPQPGNPDGRVPGRSISGLLTRCP